MLSLSLSLSRALRGKPVVGGISALPTLEALETDPPDRRPWSRT